MAVVEVAKGAFLFNTGRMSQVPGNRIVVKMDLATLTAQSDVLFWGGPTGGDTEGVAAFSGSVAVKNDKGSVLLTRHTASLPSGNDTHSFATFFDASFKRDDEHRTVILARSRLNTGICPDGTTLRAGQAPSEPVFWPQAKFESALKAVAFE